MMIWDTPVIKLGLPFKIYDRASTGLIKQVLEPQLMVLLANTYTHYPLWDIIMNSPGIWTVVIP